MQQLQDHISDEFTKQNTRSWVVNALAKLAASGECSDAQRQAAFHWLEFYSSSKDIQLMQRCQYFLLLKE